MQRWCRQLGGTGERITPRLLLAPLIRFRPWRYINLFTYLLTYFFRSIQSRTNSEIGLCVVAYLVPERTYRRIALHEFHNIFCLSPLNYFLLVSCQIRATPLTCNECSVICDECRVKTITNCDSLQHSGASPHRFINT